jgi:hypothetical protein
MEVDAKGNNINANISAVIAANAEVKNDFM